MAILGKIRERSVFLIFIIGMALLAFVFTGIFDGNSTVSQEPVIIVGDEEVGIEEFSRQVDFVERNYGFSTMQAVNFAYNQTTNAKAFSSALEAIGLAVGKNHIEQYLKKDPNFSSDPQFQGEDGAFDPQKFTDFILDLSQNNPQGFEQWKAQEANIINNIKVQLYQDMINVGIYTTEFEAKQEYALQNDLVDIDYVQIPYTVVADSLIEVTSQDIAAYIKENKETYKREASRDLKYVQFAEVTTPEDKVLIENELRTLLSSRTLYNEVSKQEETYPSFAKIDQASLASFVSEHSEIPYANTFVTESEITENYASTLFNLKNNQVFGPYEDNGYSKLTRLVERRAGGKAKARHILVSYVGASNAAATITRTKADAKKEANALLRKARRGADFAQLARDNSDGPSASSGGELPEFVREDMVAPFSDYVFSNRVGAIGLVETDFGFHVVEIMEKKDVVKLATVAKKLVPSDDTSNRLFATATQFELDIQGLNIEEVAKTKGYVVRSANDTKRLDESLPMLGNQRQIVRWAFEEERQPNDIKRFVLNTGGYIIVQVASIKAEGLPAATDVAAEVTPLVAVEKKKEYLLEQINAYTSLKEVADQFDQTISSSKAVNRFTAMLTGVGKEPNIVGAASSLVVDQVSAPLSGKSGVFVVQLKGKTPATALPSYAGYKASILNLAKQGAQANFAEAVKSTFEIQDNRSLYY